MNTNEYRHLRRGYRGYRRRNPSTHDGASTQPKPKKLPTHQGFKWNRYLIVVVARSRGRTPRFSGAGAGQATPAHLSSAFHASNPPHPLWWGVCRPHEFVAGADDTTFAVAGSDHRQPRSHRHHRRSDQKRPPPRRTAADATTDEQQQPSSKSASARQGET